MQAAGVHYGNNHVWSHYTTHRRRHEDLENYTSLVPRLCITTLAHGVKYGNEVGSYNRMYGLYTDTDMYM